MTLQPGVEQMIRISVEGLGVLLIPVDQMLRKGSYTYAKGVPWQVIQLPKLRKFLHLCERVIDGNRRS